MADRQDDPTRVHPASRQSVRDKAAAPTVVDRKSLPDDIAATRMHSPKPSGVLDPPTQLAVASARRKKSAVSLRPGTLIKGRFRLEKEIGRGGMGVVYTARDLRKEEVGDQDSLVALKLLSEDFKQHPDSLRMLQQETRKTQQLAHPNIVTVYDFDRDGDTVYMTMEYLTGNPLTDFVEKHEHIPSSLADVLPIISDITQGLVYAHKQGIVHSDLKPGNVFVTEKGVTKVLDFGIARAMMQVEPGSKIRAGTKGKATESSTGLETNDLIALTPRYASPEMFDGAPPDPRDDVYALAVMTYQLLAGEHPFKNRSAEKARAQGLKVKRIDGLNDRQWKGLLQGLALSQEKRTPRADEFLQAFLPKTREPWKFAAAGLALITIASLAYFSLKPVEAPDLFDHPLPEVPVSEQVQAKLNDAIELGEMQMMVGRLVSPPESNALYMFNQALELRPYDRRAIEGLRQLLDKLVERAQQSLGEGRPDEALKAVKVGLSIYPKHAGLLEIQSELAGN